MTGYLHIKRLAPTVVRKMIYLCSVRSYLCAMLRIWSYFKMAALAMSANTGEVKQRTTKSDRGINLTAV